LKDVRVRVSELRLDPDNPRIFNEEGQINLRQAILDEQGSKIAELADDIVKNGLNPMDRLMVLQPDKQKKEFVTLEGNRRAAALQILANPALLTDLTIPDSLRNKLSDLADNFDPKSVEPIAAVLMPDRESARRWIELRHTGENSGRGIVDWTGVQSARFRGDRVLQLLEFVKKKGDLSETESKAVTINFPITTLDRLVSNPAVRQRIGVQIVDGEFFLMFPAEEAVKPLKRLVVDLATKKINVSSVKTKDQQIEYVDGLPKNVFPQGKKLPSPLALEQVLSEKPKPAPPKPPPPPNPLNRKTLIPSGFFLAIANQKAAQIFWELRSLNLDRFPVAGAVLLRTFVEAIIEIYMTTNSLPKKHTSGKHAGKDLSLAERVETTLQHAGSKLTKAEAKAARLALTSNDSVISVSRLHEYVHNPAVFPSRTDLIAAWSGVEAFFRVVAK
jgi:hypothetical protein